MRPLALLLITTLCTITAAAAEITPTCSDNAGDTDIAMQFYPQALAEEYQRVLPPEQHVREVCVARADLGRTGKDEYLIAAYGNEGKTVVGVIRTQPRVELVVLDTDQRYMGNHPRLQLEDLDGDGIPEILLAALVSRSPGVWVLKWTTNTLARIGPTYESPTVGTDTMLNGNVELFDVTGDGLSDLIQPRGSRFNDDTTNDVYTINDGKAVLLGVMPWTGYFERSAGEPNTSSTDVTATPGQYVLRIINGYGSPNVTSAEVILNDELVFNASDFKRNTPVLEATVALRTTNQLRVTVRGEPGASFQLVFLPKP